MLRRSIHITMILIPIAYYWHGHALGVLAGLKRDQLTTLLTFGIMLGEAIRLSLGAPAVFRPPTPNLHGTACTPVHRCQTPNTQPTWHRLHTKQCVNRFRW